MTMHIVAALLSLAWAGVNVHLMIRGVFQLDRELEARDEGESHHVGLQTVLIAMNAACLLMSVFCVAYHVSEAIS